jgi:hypothetical protein
MTRRSRPRRPTSGALLARAGKVTQFTFGTLLGQLVQAQQLSVSVFSFLTDLGSM